MTILARGGFEKAFGFFGAFWMSRAQILAYERRSGVAQTPGRQDDENHNADRNRVSGECRRAEDADDAHQANPTGVGDGELQNAGERNADQPPEDIPL